MIVTMENKETSKDSDKNTQNKEANKLNQKEPEYGGQEGLDPTRYGDWEKGGRCTDF